MGKFQDLAERVIKGDIEGAQELSKSLLDAGEDPLAIIGEGLTAGINEVGVRFKNGEMFVPEMMMSAQAMKAGVEIVKPSVAAADMPVSGKVVIGSVQGDLHDIGKNLVIMMLESGGFDVIDLGVDVPVEKFVQSVKENKAGIVGMSSLLTTTMPVMKKVIDALEEENLREDVRVIIGGAPVSRDFATEIGADGYSPDAASAAELCKSFS